MPTLSDSLLSLQHSADAKKFLLERFYNFDLTIRDIRVCKNGEEYIELVEINVEKNGIKAEFDIHPDNRYDVNIYTDCSIKVVGTKHYVVVTKTAQKLVDMLPKQFDGENIVEDSEE